MLIDVDALYNLTLGKYDDAMGQLENLGNFICGDPKAFVMSRLGLDSFINQGPTLQTFFPPLTALFLNDDKLVMCLFSSFGFVQICPLGSKPNIIFME